MKLQKYIINILFIMNYVNGVTNMFDKITIPYESVMLFNIVKLKENVTIEDVEGLIGEMCFVVK